MKRVHGKAAWGLAVLLAVAPGCGGDGGNDGDVPADGTAETTGLGKYEGGCEHMAEGPGQPVAAVAYGAVGAPDVGAGHTRFDMDLASVEGGKGGDVAYPAAEATDYVIALDADVPLAILDGSGAQVAIEETLRTGLPCNGVAVFHTVELDVGSYTLRLGPTSIARVSMVIEEAAGHVHEHE